MIHPYIVFGTVTVHLVVAYQYLEPFFSHLHHFALGVMLHAFCERGSTLLRKCFLDYGVP